MTTFFKSEQVQNNQSQKNGKKHENKKQGQNVEKGEKGGEEKKKMVVTKVSRKCK